MDITFSPGVQSGWNQTFQGLGDDHDDAGFLAGDLIVTVKVADHPYFRRVGDDVLSELSLSVVQATCGCKLRIPSIYGTVTINIAPGTQPDEKIAVPEHGFPVAVLNTIGTMILSIRISIPKNITAEEEALLRQFDKLYKARISQGL